MRIGVGILIAAVVALLVSLAWAGFALIDQVDGANLADVVSALEAGTNELVLIGLIRYLDARRGRPVRAVRAVSARHDYSF